MLPLTKAIGGPGSTGFLALGCVVGLLIIYVWPRRRALGRWWLFGLYSSYLVLGVPAIANRLAAPLAFSTVQAGSVDTLMVFGGDNAVGRVQETVRVWRRQAPEEVIVSGEEWFIDRIVEAGVPRARIRWDQASATTREQVAYLRTYAATHPRLRIAVICSRLHARRVEALLRSAALAVSVIPAPVDREPSTSGIGALIPTYAGLRVSRDALYERFALAYYERHGWIAAPDGRRQADGTR